MMCTFFLRRIYFLDETDRKAALDYRFTFYFSRERLHFNTDKIDLSGNQSWIDNPDLIYCDIVFITSAPKRRLHRE